MRLRRRLEREDGVAEHSDGGKPPENQGPENRSGEAKKPKKEKVSIDPAQRGPNRFNRAQLKGKDPIFRKSKKAGR